MHIKNRNIICFANYAVWNNRLIIFWIQTDDVIFIKNFIGQESAWVNISYKGCFEEDEREYFLMKAKKAIVKKFNEMEG